MGVFTIDFKIMAKRETSKCNCKQNITLEIMTFPSRNQFVLLNILNCYKEENIKLLVVMFADETNAET